MRINRELWKLFSVSSLSFRARESEWARCPTEHHLVGNTDRTDGREKGKEGGAGGRAKWDVIWGQRDLFHKEVTCIIDTPPVRTLIEEKQGKSSDSMGDTSTLIGRDDRDYSATHSSTAFCTKWPKFSLVDFNNLGAHSKDGQQRHTYGLDSLPAANATLVGQLFADSSTSLEVAAMLMKIKAELRKEFDLRVNVVFLNYAMPLVCTLKPCAASNCEAYYGGCAPDSDVLSMAKWQNSAAIRFPEMAIFQDTKDKMVWRKLGGGMNDILVYDQSGLLYSYGCSSSTCLKGTPGFNSDTLTPLGYQNIKSMTHLAANTVGELRCQAGSQCLITRNLAPDSWMSNEYVDIIVAAILVFVGIGMGVVVPKMWAMIQNKFFATTAIARDRFIQLSTIDDDFGLDDDEGFI